MAIDTLLEKPTLFTVSVSSNFGTAQPEQTKFCTNTFGPMGENWEYENYMWHGLFFFRNEAHAALFSLKFK